jgi:predicted peptidase
MLSLPYELVKPPGFDLPGAKLPLVVFLHGSGDGGNRPRLNFELGNLLRTTQRENMLRYNPCGPRCVTQFNMYADLAAQQDPAFDSFLLVPQIRPDSPSTSWGTGNLGLVRDMINSAVTQYNVDTDRIYLLGYSAGGSGAYRMLSLYPDLFAAATTFAGPAITSVARNIADIPIWMFHSTDDPIVNVSSTRSMFDALTAAGGSPLMTLYTNVGHDSFNPALLDRDSVYYPWLFSQSLVPEPTSGVLLAMPFGIIALRGRRTRRLKNHCPKAAAVSRPGRRLLCPKTLTDYDSTSWTWHKCLGRCDR